jgi:nucleoid DNA-binding protein
MNKNDLSSAIAQEMNTTKKQAKDFIDSFCSVVENKLIEGEEITLKHFGSFTLRRRRGNTDPHNLTVKVYINPCFRPADNLKTKIKEAYEYEADS